MTETAEFKYEIAFSFVSSDEAIAIEIDSELSDRFSTFLYSNRQSDLAFTDGEESYRRVFLEQSRFVLVLYRTGWGETSWTRVEQEAIRERGYEQGYDFVKFVVLNVGDALPKWLSRFQIWYHFKRWGVPGLIGAIEARIQDLGGSARTESVDDRAARLARHVTFANRRAAFRQSYEGVNEAKASAGRIILAADAKLKQIVVKHGLRYETKQRDDGPEHDLIVLGGKISLAIRWRQRAANSLDDCSFLVELWHGHPLFRGIVHFEDPTKVRAWTFGFDLGASLQRGWIERGKTQLLDEEAVASFAVKAMLDQEQTETR